MLLQKYIGHGIFKQVLVIVWCLQLQTFCVSQVKSCLLRGPGQGFYCNVTENFYVVGIGEIRLAGLVRTRLPGSTQQISVNTNVRIFYEVLGLENPQIFRSF